MVVTEDIESFSKGLDDLSSQYRSIYCCIRKMKGDNMSKSLIRKSEEYMVNGSARLERVMSIFNAFSSQFSQLCDHYMNEVNTIEKEEINEVEELKDGFENIIDEFTKKNDEFKKQSPLYSNKDPSFVYKNDSKSSINVDLVMKYPGSYFYREYINGKRTKDGHVFIDCDGENDELIMKYMKNDKSLNEEVKKMPTEKKMRLLNDLVFLELPVKKDVMKQIGKDEDNEMMAAWRNRKSININEMNSKELNEHLKNQKLLNSLFNNELLKDIHYDQQSNSFYINLKLKYANIIEDYLEHEKKLNNKLVMKYVKRSNVDDLIDEMQMIGIILNEKEKKEIRNTFDARLLKESRILENNQYDSYLREWLGSDSKWKLIYRASAHGYIGTNFHDKCDNKGPTLIIIKSDQGWIFGGYTTESWDGWSR